MRMKDGQIGSFHAAPSHRYGADNQYASNQHDENDVDDQRIIFTPLRHHS